MQVTHFDSVIRQVIGQIFGHALGQGGHQHTLVLFDALVDFRQQIVNLGFDIAHLHYRINQPGRPHHLFYYLPRMLAFIVTGCGRHKHRLRR